MAASKLQLSWYDSVWIPMLNQNNVMEYFSQRSNPFYDRTCNNEVIRMQRADPAQLVNMTGIEFSLLLVQEPILYVIRKVHRQSPDKVVPLADYYILGGVVYQCPDLQSLINSRLLSALHCVQQAFDEVYSYSRYDPGTGYYWKFPGDTEKTKSSGQSGVKQKDTPSGEQKKRVDGLLAELIKAFPPKVFQSKDGAKPDCAIAGGIKGVQDTPTVMQAPKKKGVAPSSDIKPPDTKKRKPSTSNNY